MRFWTQHTLCQHCTSRSSIRYVSTSHRVAAYAMSVPHIAPRVGWHQDAECRVFLIDTPPAPGRTKKHRVSSYSMRCLSTARPHEIYVPTRSRSAHHRRRRKVCKHRTSHSPFAGQHRLCQYKNSGASA
eukprot:139411-Rhodomonas_salina.2